MRWLKNCWLGCKELNQTKDELIKYFLYTMQTLNICTKDFDAIKWLLFQNDSYEKSDNFSKITFEILLYTLWVFTIETWRVLIADSCTFHLNLTCCNATNHCPRASFPLLHGSRGLHCHWGLFKDMVCKLRYIVANVLWRNDQSISITIKCAPLSYQIGGNRKRSEQSMNVDHK